jgi:hypothetical protein
VTNVSEPEKDKWKPGTMELATLRRADAERKKAEEIGKFRELIREIFEWIKSFKTKE